MCGILCCAISFLCMIRCILLLAIFLTGTITLTIVIGSKVQKQKSAKVTPPLKSLYTQDSRVCAMYDFGKGPIFTTYPNAASAVTEGTQIAQCGNCGDCSNLQDYQVYVQRKEEIYSNIMTCVTRRLVVRKLVTQCLEAKNQFSSACTSCYTDYTVCAAKHCGFVCVSDLILQKPTWNKDGQWNSCVQCAEASCRSNLLTCAGADDRRLNIPLQQVKRPQDEMCNQTQVNWSTYGF